MKLRFLRFLRCLARGLAAFSAALAAGCATTGQGSYVPPPSSSFEAGGPAYAPGGVSSSARESLAQGDVAAAAAGFAEAVNVNPFDPIALNNLAVAKTEAGEFHEALGLLERASRLAPQNSEIAANLARLRSWNQNYAMDDGRVVGQTGQGSTSRYQNLPPEPPALWAREAAGPVAAPVPTPGY